ncbi:MAG: type II secretion system protein [Deferribacterota bacterium]|nr:type II secretion system protein [Deferribacterota bacterium]
MTNNKAFTLIELLVVIAIITILATISVPQFAKYRVRAYNAAALSDLRNFKVDFEAYYTDIGNLGYPDVLFDTMTAGQWATTDDITTALNNDTWNDRLSFIPSNRVEVYYDVSGNNQIYVIGTKHLNGSAIYASTSHTSRIYGQQNEDWVGQSAQGLVTMPTLTTGTAEESQNYKDVWFTENGWTAI